MIEQLTTVLLAARAGWSLGYISARVTDYLQQQDGRPLVTHGLLVRNLVRRALVGVVMMTLSPLVLLLPLNAGVMMWLAP